jgi:hypothetical protein
VIQDPLDILRGDFKLFLAMTWEYLGLPPPTTLQFDIADRLANGETKIAIEAFRGVGKSFLTSAYVVWELLKDPQKKILVVSASKNRADNFTTMTMGLLQMPALRHLIPKEGQRQSKVEFDVAPAVIDQSPSVKSVGITSQITGTRADIIVADDVEVMNNSATSDMREKLLERTREFSAILKPLTSAKTIYLGTPQTEDSIYNKLPETFKVYIWPAQIPTPEEADKYGTKLAPYILNLKGAPGDPTDPKRFTAVDLMDRRIEYGASGYQLQFMLNTQLSDEDRYPLKIKDLVVADTGVQEGPMVYHWMPDVDRQWKELPNLAMAGDRFYQPMSVSKDFAPYTGAVMAIDPSGRGRDETGYAVVKMLNGFLTVRRCGGLQGGYDTETLTKLAYIAKEEQVNHVIYESNFGDGMWGELFKPILQKIHPVFMEEVKHSAQKELRIIDTIEPVMARHRLIIDRKVIEDDHRSAQVYDSDNRFTKTLIYQMTRITKDRGALKHDDRLDALSMAVAYWVEQMAVDERKGLRERRSELMDLELERFMEHALDMSGRYTKSSNNWIS